MFDNLIGPSLLKTCPGCGGSGRMPLATWIECEPCDGSGRLPNPDGRALLELLGDGRIPLGPGEVPGATS